MMKNKFKILLLLTVFWKCDGHLRLLGDILSSAHDRIHSKVENVAGAVLGGISHGLNFNVDGHFGVQTQRQQNNKPDTVVVIIKEEDHDNNFRPPHPNLQQPNESPYNNNGYRPNPPQNYRPNYGFPNMQEENINNPQHGPIYGHNTQNSHGYGDNNYNQNPNNEQGNNYGSNPNVYPENNNNGQNSFNQPNNNYNGFQPNNNPGINDNYPGTDSDKSTQTPEKPSTEFVTKKPDYKPKEDITTAKPVDDDEPFFVPLNPNEYHYGGDKIEISAPKRDTNKKTEAEDEEYNIDVRMKDAK